MCVADLGWWWKCQLTVTRVLLGQGNSCHGSGCLHVGAWRRERMGWALSSPKWLVPALRAGLGHL